MNKKVDSNLAAFIWGHTTFIKSICIKCLIVGIYYDVELILMMLFRKKLLYSAWYTPNYITLVAMHLF